MGDKEDVEKNTTRSTDWEVVSLTASAYAASPGPKQVQSKDDDDVKQFTPSEAEASHPLYMSRHFVFQSNDQDNNIPSEDKATKNIDLGLDMTLKGLDLAKDDDEFSGLELFDDEAKREDNNNVYKTAMTSLQDDERAFGGSHVYEQKDPLHEQTDPDVTPDVSNDSKDEKHPVENSPPCEPWWKRGAASLVSHAKETNTVWSIFIAAAVMGVVVLGQRWQHERWQILQLKWESSIGNEKAGRLMGPISRLKQAFVGGQRRDSFIRVSSHNDS